MGRMKHTKVVYLWQCIKCREYIYSEDVLLKHCDKLAQWVQGIEGKGIDMNSPRVRIKVSGYIEMSQESLNTILESDYPHTGLVYSVHMGYTDTQGLEFEPE